MEALRFTGAIRRRPIMRQRFLVAVILSLTALSARAQGVAVASLQITDTSNNTYSAWVGYIDLANYGKLFQPVVRGSACNQCKQYPSVTLLDTKTFSTSFPNIVVAVTANSGLGLKNFVNGDCESTADGLIISNGQLVNPPGYQGPVLYFPTIGSPVITAGPLPALNTIQWAVAGSAVINNDCTCGQLGTLLVSNGAPGTCAVPKSAIKAARGAAGLTANGVLILAIVQGTEGSSGMTTAQFAQLLIGLGAYDAVNFDGGGSTAFIWNPGAITLTEETSLHALATGGAGFNVTPSWQSVSSRFNVPSCTTCTSYRPVYANLGIQLVK
jgi:hypothetical protein